MLKKTAFLILILKKQECNLSNPHSTAEIKHYFKFWVKKNSLFNINIKKTRMQSFQSSLYSRNKTVFFFHMNYDEKSKENNLSRTFEWTPDIS